VSRRSPSILLLVLFLVLIADQLSKLLIIEYFQEGQSLSIIGNLVRFQFIYNEGGVMGTRIGPSWIYTILTVFALILIIRFLISDKTGKMSSGIALALIAAGAIGNLIDRIRFGKVIDFIDIDIPDIHFLNIYRWFTFNVADAAITAGLAIFVIVLLFQGRQTAAPDSSKPFIDVQGNPGDRQ